MNANKEMLAGYADPDASYPDADPDATLIIWIQVMLILMLIYVSELCPCAVMKCDSVISQCNTL